MFGPLGFSLAPYVKSSRTLSRWITPIASWYANASGYRKYGFKYDDLCMQSQLVEIGIFRSPPLLALSG
jgi:ubiquinol-cytochrome c reductase subunit 7